MKPSGNDKPSSALGGFKVSWGTAMWILLLTLAVWIYFYHEHLPLDAPSTAVVALTVTVMVVVVQWLWSHLRRSREDQSGTTK